MHKYSVLFVQTLWDQAEDQPPTFMEKHIFLPFVPFIGLEIGSDEFKIWGAVQRVVWHSDLDQFWAYCPDDFSLRETNHLSTIEKIRTVNELVDLYLDYCWKKMEGKK